MGWGDVQFGILDSSGLIASTPSRSFRSGWRGASEESADGRAGSVGAGTPDPAPHAQSEKHSHQHRRHRRRAGSKKGHEPAHPEDLIDQGERAGDEDESIEQSESSGKSMCACVLPRGRRNCGRDHAMRLAAFPMPGHRIERMGEGTCCWNTHSVRWSQLLKLAALSRDAATHLNFFFALPHRSHP